MIGINRVTKVVKGGRSSASRRWPWSATVTAASAWARARHAKCRLGLESHGRGAAQTVKVPLKNGTLTTWAGSAWRLTGVHPTGVGRYRLIAGGPMRAVFDVMGVTNVVAKKLRLQQPLQPGACDLECVHPPLDPVGDRSQARQDGRGDPGLIRRRRGPWRRRVGLEWAPGWTRRKAGREARGRNDKYLGQAGH